MTENTVLLCEGLCYLMKREKESQHFYSMAKKKKSNPRKRKYIFKNNSLNDRFEQESKHRANSDELL